MGPTGLSELPKTKMLKGISVILIYHLLIVSTFEKMFKHQTLRQYRMQTYSVHPQLQFFFPFLHKLFTKSPLKKEKMLHIMLEH